MIHEPVSITPERQDWFDSLVDDDFDEWIGGLAIPWEPARYCEIQAVNAILGILSTAARASGGSAAGRSLMCRFPENDYHSDIKYWPHAVAQHFERSQNIFPPPLFIAEVLSPSTAERDRGMKFEDYAAHGVREYWIVDPDARTIEQFISDDCEPYRLLRKLDSGTLKCEVIDGFALDVESVFAT